MGCSAGTGWQGRRHRRRKSQVTDELLPAGGEFSVLDLSRLLEPSLGDEVWFGLARRLAWPLERKGEL